MAKGNLFLSQARGKVGSVVFYRQDGEQVSRVYTNQVSNPRTTAQSQQRAIFTTVSQWAREAKYIIDQGQEGKKTGIQSRRFFQKNALRSLRAQIESQGNACLNAYGVRFAQPVAIPLTTGTLQGLTPEFIRTSTAAAVLGGYGGFKAFEVDFSSLMTMTLREFFDLNPSLGLGKQFTIAWLAQDEAIRSSEGDNPLSYDPSFGDNYQTSFHYAEIVFTTDTSALDLPVFVNYDQPTTGGNFQFNPEVLAPSWGGTDDFPGLTSVSASNIDGATDGVMVIGLSYSWASMAAIVSDYQYGSWKRSNSTLVVNPALSFDLNAIISTYENGTSEVASNLYLDQSEAVSTANNTPTPYNVDMYAFDGDSTSMISDKIILSASVTKRRQVTKIVDSTKITGNSLTLGVLMSLTAADLAESGYESAQEVYSGSWSVKNGSSLAKIEGVATASDLVYYPTLTLKAAEADPELFNGVIVTFTTSRATYIFEIN